MLVFSPESFSGSIVFNVDQTWDWNILMGSILFWISTVSENHCGRFSSCFYEGLKTSIDTDILRESIASTCAKHVLNSKYQNILDTAALKSDRGWKNSWLNLVTIRARQKLLWCSKYFRALHLPIYLLIWWRRLLSHKYMRTALKVSIHVSVRGIINIPSCPANFLKRGSVLRIRLCCKIGWIGW